METYSEPIEGRRDPSRPVAGVLAGLMIARWVVMFPRGIPWSSVNFFSAAVIGRVMPDNVSYLSATILHFALAALYGLVIGAVIGRIRPSLAILTGALVGGVLYLLNLAVVYFVVHWAYGREPAVLIGHILFGAFAAGVYRGLISRRQVPISVEPVVVDQDRSLPRHQSIDDR